MEDDELVEEEAIKGFDFILGFDPIISTLELIGSGLIKQEGFYLFLQLLLRSVDVVIWFDNHGWGFMERGFLDNSVKKKKEGGSKEVDGSSQVLGDLARRVKNIEGKPMMPKGILKKVMRNVAADTQDVVVPLNDVNNANMDESGSMKNKEDANLVKGDTTAVIAKSCSLADSHGNKDPSIAATTNEDLPKTACSFANVVLPKDSFTKVHVRTLINEEKIESFDCVFPKAAAAKVKSRYENSIVGFFVGKDPSFPVVQQYVSNTWRKFGLEKITRNDDGVYLFKFASKSGMDQVLEKGPWLIRKSPIIVNKWTASVSLKKGEVTKVPVWVKLYNVPILAYSEDGLSLIATQIGKLLWPILMRRVDGHTIGVHRVVYEWKPPHCVDCQSFGHDTNLCPKHVREEIPKTSTTDAKANTMDENDDGFVEVKSRKKKKGADSRSFGRLRLNKPNSKVIWQQKKGVDAKGGSSASPSVSTNDNGKGNGCSKPDLNSSNPFDVLNVEGEEMGKSGQQPKVSEHVGTVHLNVNKKKAQEPNSSKSAINDVQEDKNVSSSPALKTWDCINESNTDDEDVIPLYGSSLGGGNQLEDEDFDFSDGYEDQVVDLPGQLKEFRDFKLHMCGRK
ncbi:retrovirus-related pol polyprotein from transposon TNT 1-94 [Tanacetum coccineum]